MAEISQSRCDTPIVVNGTQELIQLLPASALQI